MAVILGFAVLCGDVIAKKNNVKRERCATGLTITNMLDGVTTRGNETSTHIHKQCDGLHRECTKDKFGLQLHSLP